MEETRPSMHACTLCTMYLVWFLECGFSAEKFGRLIVVYKLVP